MFLTYEEAERAVDAAIFQATMLQIKVSVAVCDAGGHLVAFKRMDGSFWAGTFGAIGKAIASTAFSAPSGALTGRAESSLMKTIAGVDGRGMILSAGGCPIIRDGRVIGACGIGGSSDENDDEVARVAVAALD